MTPRDHYAPTHAASGLSRWQKGRLCVLARHAWIASGKPDDEATWRRNQSIRACGARISEASQAQWAPLKAHFLTLAGHSGLALNTLVRDAYNARRLALKKLAEKCASRGLPLAYPAAICRRQYRCELVDATPPQIWRLFFTIHNRRPTQ